MITIEIEGADELAKKLRELPEKVAKRFMSQALKAAARPVLAEARFNCPSKTGALVAGMHINSSNRKGETMVKVSNNRDQYYAVMYERGAKGPGKRVQKPRPFMGPALAVTSAEAVGIAAAILKEKIEDEMKV